MPPLWDHGSLISGLPSIEAHGVYPHCQRRERKEAFVMRNALVEVARKMLADENPLDSTLWHSHEIIVKSRQF